MTARGCAVIAAVLSLCSPASGQTTAPDAPRGDVGAETPKPVVPSPSPQDSDKATGGSPAQPADGKPASPPPNPATDAKPAPPSTARPPAEPVAEPLPILVPPPPGVQMPSPPGTPAPAPAQRQPQKEAGWYNGGSYSFNLLNIEYYDLDTKDIHFSGQRRDIDNEWAGLAELLAKSKEMGFVEIDRKFINLRNLSSIHDLGGSRGATLTFRDGATLKITGLEMGRLIEITK